MRILFSSTGAVGHFRSLAPFIDACAERGEETLVAGPPWLAGTAQEKGYEFVAFEAPSADDLGRLRSGFENLPEDERNAAVRREAYGRLRPQASVRMLNEICRDWQPDAVIREHAEFGSALAAELHRIPVIRVSRLASFEEGVIAQCAEPLGDLRSALGLPADPGGERLRHSPSVTFWPASLEDPGHASASRPVRFRDPSWDDPVSELDRASEDGMAPLIYVTFGTVTGTLPIASRVYTTLIEAITGLPVRGLLTAGRIDGKPYPFPALPPNLRTESWVNEVRILSACSAVVCHGGSGSILAPVAAGVPLVLVPLFGDQHANAQRVSEFGAGTVAELDAESIRHATLRVLNDEANRRQAQALASELRTHAHCQGIVELIAELRVGAPGGLVG